MPTRELPHYWTPEQVRLRLRVARLRHRRKVKRLLAGGLVKRCPCCGGQVIEFVDNAARC